MSGDRFPHLEVRLRNFKLNLEASPDGGVQELRVIGDPDCEADIAANTLNPRDVKIWLAKELIARYHDEAAAEAAHNDFTQRFSKNAIPDEMPEVTVSAPVEGIAVGNLLKEAALVETTSEALRMIKQNAVKRDGEVVADGKLLVTAGTAVWQVGKRKFARITVA